MTPRRIQEPAADPRLDRYRRIDARVFDGDELAAHLSLRVEVWWRQRGWWRARWVDPAERIEWLLAFAPGYEQGHPDGWDEGEISDVEDALGELAHKTFTYRGRALRLEWLEGEEAQRARQEHGWDSDDSAR